MDVRPLIAAITVAVLFICPAYGDSIGFGPNLEAAGWRVATMPGRAPAKFSVASDGSLEILAEAAVAWLWRPITESDTRSTLARWRWRVDEGVGPTNLTRRGGDDRALALYFVFGQRRESAADVVALLRDRARSRLRLRWEPSSRYCRVEPSHGHTRCIPYLAAW
jgi:hypothetical protein